MSRPVSGAKSATQWFRRKGYSGRERLLTESARKMKLIEISRMHTEGMISISGLRLMAERPEKNMPPQLMTVKALSALAMPGLHGVKRK